MPVFDNYGSTEGGVTVMRTADQPKRRARPPPRRRARRRPGERYAAARRRGSTTRAGCSTRRSASARSSTPAPSSFEGYYKNDEAVRERTRNGWYWSGDLGYVDADGWLWFAGRDYDWLRVDGENFAAAPVERIVGRFPGVVLAAVYAVPAADVGDEVMVALQLEPGVEFDPDAFDEFLGRAARPRREVEPALRADRGRPARSPRRARS